MLDGKAVAAKVQAAVATGVGELRARGVVPTLAVVLVGRDPASQIYVGRKRTACQAVGIVARDHLFPEGLDETRLLGLVRELSADRAVHGILIQLPLPPGVDEDRVLAAVDPTKDVDGFHPENLGRLLAGHPTVVPGTPAGILEILDHYGIELKGAEAVVVGRSRIVGKPLAQLLLGRHATVTICHTRTRDLAAHTRRAELLAVAAGRPGVVTGDMVRPDAVVVDVGTNRLPDGRVVGDVDAASVAPRVRAITPVPGGVGPMTVAMLMRNTLEAARRHAALG
ncbi:MAG TPA: bifunctional 5,10-methylenetetrahydrofolate dehydrogenase/5,10-methenyltetrahydrofolate cyclohydrolase [Methylomirabilota bacterium]|nr:bifunctional 5,10-methylenetetrahydrofolate dehydrogenase/5,10-methenyltetrahydrofolate cyclohydrolase [Methylomirabilota bacterium]